MVQDNNTTAPTQDAIDQEQYRLDAQQQGSTEEPQYVTVGQYNQLQSQLRTVQGMLHKGFNTATNNAIQGAKQYFNDELARLTKGAEIERVMAQVPEENQEWARQLLNVVNSQQPAAVQTNTDTGDTGYAPTDEQERARASWRPHIATARTYGLNPRDARIQWGYLTEPNLTQPQREMRWHTHLGQLQAADAAARQAKQPAPQATNRSAPPVENGPGPSTFSDGSYEALLDDIATRRKTPGQGREIAARNGWTI